MAEVANAADPRWGQEGREEKAEAIFGTLRMHSSARLEEGTWLDLGCGSGGIAATLAGRVRRMVGVDPEPWQRWDGFRTDHANLEFHVGTYATLASILPPQSVDVVICNQVYEHVDDAAALLRAIRLVMKHEGICYFAGPNWLWPIEPHVFWPFVHWLPRTFAQRLMRSLGSSRADQLDAWPKSFWELTRLFRDAGLRHRVAIRARVLSGARPGGRGGLITDLMQRVPERIVNALSPFAPGFVFTLTHMPDDQARAD